MGQQTESFKTLRNFKVKVKNAYNNLVQQDYNIALKLYQNLLEDAKGKRKYNFRYNLVINLQKLNLKWYRAERIETALFPPSEHLATRRRKPFKPKKKTMMELPKIDAQLLRNKLHQIIYKINDTITSHKNLVEKHNTLVKSHNVLRVDHDTLRADHNQLRIDHNQ